MTSTNNSTAISTSTATPKFIQMPLGLKMALSMTGVNVEAVESLLNAAVASGDVEAILHNILASAETIQRVEKKLDLIINHLKIDE